MKTERHSPEILLINQYCGFLCRDIANGLAKAFGRVHLITGNPEGNAFDPMVSVSKGVKYNRKNLLTRFYTWSVFTIQCLLKKEGDKAKAWVLVTNPPLVPIFLGRLAFQKNIPYFLVIYDLYPDALSQVKLIRKNSLFFRFWEKSNRKVFEKAAGIVTLSEDMKLAISKYLPISYSSIQVVPNWFEERPKGSPNGTNPFKGKWEGKLVILYSGNFGLTHDLESIIESAKILKSHTQIQFVLAGDGAKKNKLIDKANEYNLRNIDFLPYQSTEDFPFLLSSVQISIVSLGIGAEDISVPSKTYTAMAAGLCLIGISSPESALVELIKFYHIGINVPPNSPQLLAKEILDLLENPITVSKFQNASKMASANFSIKNLDQYIELIKAKIDIIN